MSDAARQVMAMISRQRQEEQFIAECLFSNEQLSRLGIRPGSYVGRFQVVIDREKKKREQQKVAFLAIAATFGVVIAVSRLKKWLSDEIKDSESVSDSSETAPMVDEQESLGARIKKMMGIRDEPGSVPAPPSQKSVNQTTASPGAGSTEWIKTVQADDDTKSTIKKAAKSTGTDYALLYGVLGAESNFRSDVKASTSSATGIGQFTSDTWSYLVSKFGLPYTDKDRTDKAKSAHVAGLYLEQINQTLTKSLGRKPSYGETYLGYFLGPSGAVRFLSALRQNPNQIAAELFERAASRNPNIFYVKGNKSQPKTFAQILSQLDGKVLSYARDVDSSVASLTPTNVKVSQMSSSVSNTSTPGDDTGSSVSAVATATPVAERIQLPSDVLTSKKSQDKVQQVSQRTASNNESPDLASVADSGTNRSTSIPFRGKDGRIYQNVQG